jgi:hypothetical protein
LFLLKIAIDNNDIFSANAKFNLDSIWTSGSSVNCSNAGGAVVVRWCTPDLTLDIPTYIWNVGAGGPSGKGAMAASLTPFSGELFDSPPLAMRRIFCEVILFINILDNFYEHRKYYMRMSR